MSGGQRTSSIISTCSTDSNNYPQYITLNFADLPVAIRWLKLPRSDAGIDSHRALKPVLRVWHRQLSHTHRHTHTPLIKVGRGIWWIRNFKHLSTLPVSRLCLIKMIEGLEHVWSPNQFTFKIQFCTCKTLILQLYAPPPRASVLWGWRLIYTSCWRKYCWFSALSFYSQINSNKFSQLHHAVWCMKAFFFL